MRLDTPMISAQLSAWGVPDYLLPGNTSMVFPDDLYYIAIATISWALYHQFCVRFIFTPVADRHFPLNKSVSKAASKPVSKSESPSKSTKSPKTKKTASVAETKQTEKTLDGARTLEQTLAQRRKFMTAAWKFVLYSTTLPLGLYVLSQEWWTFSPKHYYFGWPNHSVSEMIRLYYFQGIGCILFMFIHIFFENLKPFDILVMVIHHSLTLSLLLTSYYFGFQRLGAVILCLHDIADPVMEFAKLCLYTGRTKLADIFFALFAVTFIVTRNFIFPVYVIASIHQHAFWEDGTELPTFWVHYSLESLLWLLEVLHIYWAYLIIKMAISAVTNKGVGDDVRDED